MIEPSYIGPITIANDRDRWRKKLSGKSQHVVPTGSKWSIRKSGAAKATLVVQTQEEAIERAKEIAKNQGVELFIHGKDGRIRERSSYGKDPFPPKG